MVIELSREKRTVKLSQEERDQLQSIITKGRHSAQEIRRAQILLLCDQNRPGGKKTISEIVEILGVGSYTVSEVKKQYSMEGLEKTLARKKRETPPVPSRITGDIEARIIAVSCGEPPEGEARWSLRLLSKRIVELEIIDEISHETVRNILKKTKSNRT